MNRHVLIRSRKDGGLVRDVYGPGERLPPDKGCEPTPARVLMFWVSEGASPKGKQPEDTPNARVAE